MILLSEEKTLESLFVFIVSGGFAMSAALFASKLTKLDVEEAPEWMKTQGGKTKVLLGGNLFGVIFVAAVIYGFMHLTWWIPLACMIVTFPAFHVIVLERLFSLAKGFFISGFIAVASTGLLWFYW